MAIGCGIQCSTPLGLAVFVVAVDRDGAAGRVADRNHAAALVSVEPAAVGDPSAFILDQWLIVAWTEDIAPLDGVRGIGFGDHVEPVIAELGRRRTRHLAQPQQRVVGERRAAARRGQQILGRVSVGAPAGRVAGEVATRVIGWRSAADRGQLIEAVGGDRRCPRAMPGPGEQVVAFGLARDLAGRIIGEGQRLVVRRSSQIVDLAGEPRDGVVAVSGDGAVAASQGGAAAKVGN